MRRSGTTFSEIIKQITGHRGHQLGVLRDSMQGKKMARLEELGVRPLAGSLHHPDGIPHEAQKIYNDAYRALQSSNKSWATESEIKDILFGDKEISRTRSAEVIEVLRKARIPGFRETDEVTPGEEYSERLIGVIESQKKMRAREAQSKHIDELLEKDRDMAGGETKKTDDTDEDIPHGIAPVSLQSTGQQLEFQNTLGVARHPNRSRGAGGGNLHAFKPAEVFKKSEQTSNKRKLTPKDKTTDDDTPNVPLTFDLHDF